MILFLILFQDTAGNKFSYSESISQIAASSTVPIYSVWDFYLERGIVGGMLSSGYYQGETAATLLLRILNGENPQDIPIIKQSPNKAMFDYKYLTQYNIDQTLIPSGSIILNKPISIYEKYSTFCLAGLLLIIILISIIQRKKAKDQLKILKAPDSLTGVLNRGTGLAILQQHVNDHQRTKNKLTIIFIDVNHLKTVNDTYGHQEGDKLIQTTSQLLLKTLRKSDIVCRLGGDEFLLIFPECDLGQAINIWTKIEECIESYNAEQHHNYLLSISHGFAEYNPAHPVSIDILIQKADMEMYATKRLYKLKLEE